MARRTKRRNTRCRVSKKNKTKRRKKTKRKMRGGSGRRTPLSREEQRLKWREENHNDHMCVEEYPICEQYNGYLGYRSGMYCKKRPADCNGSNDDYKSNTPDKCIRNYMEDNEIDLLLKEEAAKAARAADARAAARDARAAELRRIEEVTRERVQAARQAEEARQAEAAARDKELVRLQESENPLAFNILNKFFREVIFEESSNKWYVLDPTKFGPNNKINVISAHGSLVPNRFFVVPEGLTLYLPVAAGEIHFSTRFGSASSLSDDDAHKNSYIRVYKEGSLIQDQTIDFNPIYGGGEYRARGLLELDVPDYLDARNATEANKVVIDFLSRQTKYTPPDLEADREEKMQSDIRNKTKFFGKHAHLTHYEDVYFENNIDGIIGKADLINSAIRLREDYYLSGILHLIAEARKKPHSTISGVWFGTFCRFGEAIDINKFKSCQESELPLLPEGFFQGDFQYEGISDTLMRQESLASTDSTINFKRILNEVFEKREQYDDDDFKESFKERIEGIKDSVDKNEAISLEDVCFVFQMKQKYP